MKFFLKIALLILLFLPVTASSQIETPVKWSYGFKKLNSKTYEVHLLATIDDGWHIYAQKQTKDAIAVPTKIRFDQVPGLQLIGLPKEIGKKETYTVKEVGIINYEYAGKVDFVQKIMINSGIKAIKGKLTYQTCTHQRCLAEETIDFTVPVN